MISIPILRNLHLDFVVELLSDGDSKIETLIIAHPDFYLESCLEEAFTESEASIYLVPQENWNMEDEELAEAILWAVEIGKVNSVLLVGCSLAGLPDQQEVTLGKEQIDSFATASDRGVPTAQDHFVRQLESLLRVPELTNRISEKEVSIEGLFYLAERRVFTHYDQSRCCFTEVK